MERCGNEAVSRYFWLREEVSALESLLSFVAELMSLISTYPDAAATRIFLGSGRRFIPNGLEDALTQPTLPLGFLGERGRYQTG